MNPTINRLKLVFLALFAIGTVAIWGYQFYYVFPAQKCDDRSGWWDRKARICATPLYIPSITGRPKGMSRKAWSERQAAREIQREREGYPTADTAETATPMGEAAAAPATATAAPAAPPAKK